MQVLSLVARLRLPSGTNPGRRRRCAEAIVERIHSHFNVSIAEVGPPSRTDELILAAACVGRTGATARDVLDRVAEALAHFPEALLEDRPEFRVLA